MFQIYFESNNNLVMKYTSGICSFVFLFWLEVYVDFQIHVFVVKLRSIFEEDFLNLQIYIQT